LIWTSCGLASTEKQLTKEILQNAGVKGDLVVNLDSGEGKLTEYLSPNERHIIPAQDISSDIDVSNLVQETLNHRPLTTENLAIDLILYRTLYQNPQIKTGPASLLVDLRKEDGIWQRVWAVAAKVTVGDQTIKFDGRKIILKETK
jgi:hypothetical protein